VTVDLEAAAALLRGANGGRAAEVGGRPTRTLEAPPTVPDPGSARNGLPSPLPARRIEAVPERMTTPACRDRYQLEGCAPTCLWPEVCAADGTCWEYERQHQLALNRPPLTVLRKANGKPNYRSAMEQQMYLVEAGWLDWSDGKTKGPPMRADSRAGRKRREEWPMSYERWIELFDPERFEAAKRAAGAPIERLAAATVESPEPIGDRTPRPQHPWRTYDAVRNREERARD
jgi:hypothetical protein